MKKLRIAFYFLFFTFCISSCKIYSFRDVSIDYNKIKTIKVNYFENKARYVNPQLSSRLTDAFIQKVSSETKLTQISGDNANYQITGTITGYDVTTSGISNNTTSQNTLTVSVHITLNNTVDNKIQDFDVSRAFPFASTLSLTEAEPSLMNDILKSLTDDIFNKVFSNW